MAEVIKFPVSYAFEVSLPTPELPSETSVAGIFQELSGIADQAGLGDLPEGGENKFAHRMPKQANHPNLLLKRGVAKRSSPLWAWISETIEPSLSSPIVPRLLTVILVAQSGEPIASWTFHDAWPVNYSVDASRSTKEEIEIERLELNYKFVERSIPAG